MLTFPDLLIRIFDYQVIVCFCREYLLLHYCNHEYLRLDKHACGNVGIVCSRVFKELVPPAPRPARLIGPHHHALDGIASYYWQDQMTASGERFNKRALTADEIAKRTSLVTMRKESRMGRK